MKACAIALSLLEAYGNRCNCCYKLFSLPDTYSHTLFEISRKKQSSLRVISFVGIIPFNFILDTKNNFANFLALIMGGFSVRASLFAEMLTHTIVFALHARQPVLPSDVYLPFLTATLLMDATVFSSAVAGHLSYNENGLMKLKSADRKTSAV